MNRPKTLTAAFVRSVRTPGRYGDGRGSYGLSLLVRHTANGRVAKTWSQRLYIRGKPVMVGLGSFPLVTLAEARDKALENRRTVELGGDPRTPRSVLTFADAAEKVIAIRAGGWKPGGKSEKQWRQVLEAYAHPSIGDRPVGEITTAEVMDLLTPIWNAKAETAQRLRQRISIIMSWAVAQGHRTDDPAGPAVTAALPRQRTRRKHFRALPYHEVPAALVKVQATGAHWATKAGFAFMVYTAGRGCETRFMTWDEVDLESATWTVPAGRMKMDLAHRVPLSNQALDVLAQARHHTGGHGLVFPTPRGAGISNNTIRKLLMDNGIDSTPHGFRASFKDWAVECSDAPNEVSELALSHVPNNRVEAAYRRTDLYERRRQLMQEWADYLTT